jgi:amino acid adenylation domain-containing protein
MIGFLIQSPLEYYANKTPEHPAMSYQGHELSYGALNQRSNQLAQALMDNGAQRQDRVGIYMYKGLDLGVAIYGILKAGCIFVPLDPFMPADRLSFILEDCEITHIISSDAFSDTLNSLAEKHDLNVYGIDVDSVHKTLSWSDIAQQSVRCPELPMIDLELGYIMYTSGSTGVPKGLMHTHSGSITYARWGAEHVGLKPEDRVASHAPLHFDLSIFDFFSTAQAGATVVLVPEAVTRFPASWTKTIDSERITVVFTVPHTLMSMIEKGAVAQRDLSSLRWILYGGEPYPPGKLRQLMLTLEDVKVTNVYGPAEAPSCTCYDVPLPPDGSNEPIPIGVVSRNSTDIIVDDNDEDCGPGQEGELCIRSSTLMVGYWNRPDLNENAYLFRESFGPFPAVYYRTGDRVVRQVDGNLQFIGRIDRMVKVRGYRVELDEVESVLTGHSDVSEAAAFTVPDGSDSLKIIAAVTLAKGAVADTADVLRLARKKLPPYAVPENIELLTTLPHNSSGKINRKLLAEQWMAGHQA